MDDAVEINRSSGLRRPERAVPFPVGDRALLAAYTKADHAGFVPPGDGRDRGLYRAWGGYEEL